VLLSQHSEMSSSLLHLPHLGCDATTPSVGIPWPIVWVANARNRKHLFCFDRVPMIEPLADTLLQFHHRYAWKQHFAAIPDVVPVPVVARYKKAPARPFDHSTSLPMAAWRAAVHKITISAAQVGRSRARWHGELYANVSPIDRLGIALLKSSRIVLVPRDKGTGYVIHTRQQFTDVHLQLLSGCEYQQISSETIAWNTIRRAYVDLCSRVVSAWFAEEFRSSIFIQLKRSLEILNNTPYTKLKITCKDHKRPVQHRNLHSSVNNSFAGLSQFVRYHLAPHIRSKPHIVKNAEQLSNILRGKRIPFGSFLVRIDMKSFFLSGTADQLSSLCSRVEPNTSNGRTFRDVVLFLLYHQYIRSDCAPGCTYQVVKGTGMGLRHSSEVANYSLYQLVELPFACNPAVQAEFGIRGYWRYFDDILVITDSIGDFKRWFMRFAELSDCFIPEIEEISRHAVNMLNMRVYVDGCGCLQTVAVFKPSSLAVPLDTISCHPPHVHSAWPRATLVSSLRLCSTFSDMQCVGKTFIARFRKFTASVSLIRCLLTTLHHELQRGPNRRTVLQINNEGATVLPADRQVVWVVLPYHPVWKIGGVYHALSKFLNSHDSQLVHQHAGYKMPVFKISLANSLKPASVVLSRN
jgi:hypothetical protein